MKKKLFYSFLSVLFVSLTIFLAISNQGKKVLVKKCKDLSYQDSYKLHPKFFSPVTIEIKFLPEKAWRRSLFKSEINAKNNQKAHNVKFYDRSARTDAIITVKVDKNIFCNLKARIRPQGLFDDHRDGTSILPSLNVELKDGNIFGITKFYLFRPKTRAYNNEIISSLIFKHSGFLSLRVTKAHVKYNNQKIEYILQEDTAKEFLEINRLKDAPIYEGTSKNYLRVRDVAGGYKYDFFKHRIINEKWSTKSDNHMNMSKTGLSILNEFMNNYVANRQIYGQGLNADYRSYEKKFLKTKYFEKFATFDALTYAARADHSLSINDRIYYYDILNNNFIPIHWDGMSHLVDRFNNVIAENLYNVTYTQSIKDGSKRGLELIKKIDLDKLDQSFKLHGVSLKKKDYKKIFQIIEENLKRFSVLPDEEIVSLKQIELKKEDLKKLNFENKSNFKFIYENKSLADYSICNISNEDCSISQLTKFETSKLIKSNLKKKDKYFIYTSKVKEDNDKLKWFHEKIKNIKRKDFKEKDLEFFLHGNIKHNINWENRSIEFTKLSKYGNVVFNNIDLDNWKIKFKNENESIQAGADSFNLTGCINFYDTVLKNVSLETINSNCDDAINFVRSEGTIKNIIIIDSKSDSIDADFSNLIFDNVLVKNSKNNCMSFSHGKYKINDANISNCLDSAISAGDISELHINNITLTNSDTGIESKDLSKVLVKQAQINNTKVCAQAHNKKQEFYGGYINFENFKCDNYLTMTKKDNLSLIKKN